MIRGCFSTPMIWGRSSTPMICGAVEHADDPRGGADADDLRVLLRLGDSGLGQRA